MEVDWRHVNFFGGARTAGSAGALLAPRSRRAREPASSRTSSAANYSLGLQGQYWHNDEPAFTLDTSGGRVTVTREFGALARPVLGGAARR